MGGPFYFDIAVPFPSVCRSFYFFLSGKILLHASSWCGSGKVLEGYATGTYAPPGSTLVDRFPVDLGMMIMNLILKDQLG